MFEVHSGKRVGPTHLRSALVTYLLDSQLSTDDSLARAVVSAIRHSTGLIIVSADACMYTFLRVRKSAINVLSCLAGKIDLTVTTDLVR